MFDHVTIRVSDLGAPEAFYSTVLRTLGVEVLHRNDELVEWANDFSIDPDGNSAEAVVLDFTKARGAIDHLWIRVADVGAARRFYETIAPVVGIRVGHERPGHVQFRFDDGSLSFLEGTPTEHVHLAFAAADGATVDAFHRTATAAGYRDNGAPGQRPEYHPGYYGAYVLDPDGNNVEAVSHNR